MRRLTESLPSESPGGQREWLRGTAVVKKKDTEVHSDMWENLDLGTKTEKNVNEVPNASGFTHFNLF